MFDKLAYIIFTSGSTDTPKGVMITHRSAANTIHDVNDRFKICDSDKLLALSSLSFDLSVYDIFGMLAAGGSIVFPDRDKIKEPFHWLELLETHKITIWNTVPMLMQMLVDYIEDIIPIAQQPAHQHYNTLRLILLSGDWIPLTLPEKIKVIFPNAQIISLGGATETSIWSVLYPIQHIDKTWKSIPYGKAMRNQKIYVLNTHLEYCPEHIEGDIYIAGEGLAIGYLDDPAQTNSHFIWHPKTGERLYRASDKGRLLPSGDIEFLGREDTQVKIGGYRIELGEIEKALTALPPIKYAMVDVHGERFSNKKMVAYLLPYESAADKLSSAEKLAFKSAQHNIKTEGLCATPISLLSPPMQEEIIRHYFARKSYRQFIKQKYLMSHYEPA